VKIFTAAQTVSLLVANEKIINQKIYHYLFTHFSSRVNIPINFVLQAHRRMS